MYCVQTQLYCQEVDSTNHASDDWQRKYRTPSPRGWSLSFLWKKVQFLGSDKPVFLNMKGVWVLWAVKPRSKGCSSQTCTVTNECCKCSLQKPSKCRIWMNWYQWNGRKLQWEIILLPKCEHLKSGRRFHNKVSFRYAVRLAFRKDFNKPVRGTRCNFWADIKGVWLFFRRSSETQKQRMLIPNLPTATKEQRSCCKCLIQRPSRCLIWTFTFPLVWFGGENHGSAKQINKIPVIETAFPTKTTSIAPSCRSRLIPFVPLPLNS